MVVVTLNPNPLLVILKAWGFSIAEFRAGSEPVREVADLALHA